SGSMSFVGPRPERPEIIEKYTEAMPEFTYRTKVKAGITGYAQIYGKYNTRPYDKLKLDLYYIENFSIWMDLKLLIQTVKIIFTLESTEGIEDGNVTPLEREEEEEDE
ncbi:MAG TPA: sugar transferase, partial [Lachnospiraceae bacterium]|nr:sugar transferase [Lachnospiraceae bacterium]